MSKPIDSVQLVDVADVIRGVTFPASAKTYDAGIGTVPCLRTSNVQASLQLDDLIRVPAEFVKRDEQWLRDGDTVMSIANSSDLVGKSAFHDSAAQRMTFGGVLAVIRAKPGRILPRYLYLHLQNPRTIDSLRSSASKTVNIANLSGSKIESLPLRLPSLDVQHRIVAKLDALLAQSRAAREQLEAVPDLVETYRQSVLAAAFRGDLTADWRKKNPDVEPASKLLERIRVERRKAWEAAELAKMTAKGKPPKDDKWKSKYAEPESVDTTGLPALPPNWCWSSLESLSDVDWGNTSLTKDSYVDEGFVAFSASGPDGRVAEFEHDGDAVVLSAIGARCGRCFRARGKWTAIKNTITIVPFRPNTEATADLLHFFLDESPAWLRKGGGQPFITLGGARPMAIPVPPADETGRVVAAIRLALEVSGSVGTAARENASAVGSLERALLAKAFSGELVA